MRKFAIVLLVFLLSFPIAFSQSPSSSPASADVDARAEKMLKQLTLEEKIDLISGVDDFYIRAVKHIGLPALKMADGPFGVRNYGPSTTLGGIGLAATWDMELAQRVGKTIGQDARARGVHFMLGPGVNIHRAPMCGRNFEYFGEDPFLASRTAVGYIEGMQSQGVSSTIKHFMGNNQEFLRHDADSIIDERTMHEIYLPTFEAAVKEAHVGAIMDSYNLTNGVHMSQNGLLNTDVVKKQWGFDGIIMSDWESTYDGIGAANGGLDLEMPSGKFMNRATLLPAIKAGKVSEATIDDKVRRILHTAIRFGWLDHDQTDSSIPLFNRQGDQVALEAARSGMVLLKNDGNLLPLDKTKIKTIAVIGPDAYPAQVVGGGSAGVRPFTSISYLEGIAGYFGKSATVYYERGIPTLGEMADATSFSTDQAGQHAGLNVEVFNNPSLGGKPTIKRVDQHVNAYQSLGNGINQNEVSARWTGYFTPAAAGEYVLFVRGPGEEGGSRLYLDDKLVMDNWEIVRARASEFRVQLSTGPHKIRLEYFVHYSWGGPSILFGAIRPEAVVSATAKSLAARADAVVIAVGFDSDIESEGGDRTFQLPPAQDELINAIAAANKNAIVVVTSGGAVDANAWIDHVPALFEAWFPGQDGGEALAQLLFGDDSPSGRLPISWERRWEDNAVHDSYYPKDSSKKVAYAEGVFLGYRHFDKAGIKPLFPFGYGLSYTTFAYKNLSITPEHPNGGQFVTVSFDVTNTGNREAADVAEVYVGEAQPKVPRPIRELQGFAKVQLAPGETRHISVELAPRAFSYYDAGKHDWTADAGNFNIYVGRSDEQIELKGSVTRQ
ncbi:MAG TPA: glycoside hydrolase family 3 C-terminal domain-containing protein [Terriglobales bacterium]|nr:glycoside hydrolase family 3 C-terminal domain-containing protein [Terriglobales bacterium]